MPVGETRQEKLLRQTNEQYAALGRYVQEFEQVLLAIRQLIVWIFRKEGLRNDDMIDVIISHRFVTAQVLVDSFSSIIIHKYPSDSDEIAIVQNLRTRLLAEIEIRNDYLHGTWFIGWANEAQQDFSEIHGFKKTSSPKKGLGMKELAKSVSELQARVSALEEIKDAYRRLIPCVIRGFPVNKNFIHVEGKYLSPDTFRRRGWQIPDQ